MHIKNCKYNKTDVEIFKNMFFNDFYAICQNLNKII